MTVNQLDRFVLLIGVWNCFSLFGIAYATCPTNWFSCGNSGVCIPRQYVCDYHSDCPNGEDEDQSCEPPWCDWHQFECSSNYTPKHDHCLQKWYLCDGQADCSDGSDEKGCDYVTCSTSSFKCDSGQCIASDLKCDGKWNCRDKSDENNCNHTVCHPNEFRCLNDSKCISITKQCDQHHDCADGSDELKCYRHSVDSYRCRRNAFVCANGWCISPKRKCDGFDDCGDLSDENGCKLSCGENQFSCADGSKCINEEYVCDATVNCADGSDETSQCSTGLCEMMQCEYTCVPSLRGGRCACPTGLYMADNTSLCEDMNECKIGGFCDQLCTNTPGSYSCSCVDGYHLEGSSCVANNSSQMRLIYTDQRSIYRLDTSGEVSAELTINTTMCSGVAYHYEKGLLLWTDMQSRKVFVGNLHDSSGTAFREISVKSTHWLPVALDVDWIRNNVYVLDQRGEKVDVFDLDGHYQYFMFAKLLIKPNDIALDPAIGLMFIADQRTILRANMDGSSLVTLVDVGLLSTTGITLDTAKKFVYFCDPERHRIEVVDYSGNNRKTVIRVANNDPSPSRLTKFESKIYWTSTQRPGVYGVDEMKGTDSIFSVYQHLQRNADIENTLALKAIHPVLQPKSSDPCYKSSCEHFCLSTNSSEASGLGYRCACSVGFQLTGSHCEKVNNFIIFTLWNYIGSLVLRNDTKQRASDTDSEKTGNMTDFSYGMEPVISPHRIIHGLEFDARKNKIYYIQSNEVCSVNLDGSSHHCSVTSIRNMSLVSLDWVTGNLYYISLLDDTLGVINTDNTVIRRELLGNLSTPVGLTVHPNKGLVFWAEWSHPPRIIRMASDGSQLFVLSNLNLSWPNGIAIDYDSDRLYWTDARYDIIGHSNLDGSDVQLAVPAHVIPHPFALVVDTDFIYVADSTSGIVRFEKINNNSNPVVLMKTKRNQRFFDVKLSSQNHQKIRSDHPCKDENGGCEQFCFAVNNGNIVESDMLSDGPNFVGTLRAQCGCSDDFQLLADSRRCVDIVCDSGHRICPGTKQCLSEALFCNGINNCPDGSDESNCKNNSLSDNSSQTSCEIGEFMCRNGACIPSNWRCDLVSDCSDFSDEFCTYTTEPLEACQEGSFRCNNSDCISIAYRCDNEYDCKDKSDESNCPQVICKESQFRCANGILCVPESFQCDKQEDCHDGSDESNCTINDVTSSMDSTQFKCESMDQFIPITSYCDGVMDCNDNSDEHHGCLQDLCEPGFFQCDNKECIVEELVCDGNRDCEDGSDERNQQSCSK